MFYFDFFYDFYFWSIWWINVIGNFIGCGDSDKIEVVFKVDFILIFGGVEFIIFDVDGVLRGIILEVDGVDDRGGVAGEIELEFSIVCWWGWWNWIVGNGFNGIFVSIVVYRIGDFYKVKKKINFNNLIMNYFWCEKINDIDNYNV